MDVMRCIDMLTQVSDTVAVIVFVAASMVRIFTRTRVGSQHDVVSKMSRISNANGFYPDVRLLRHTTQHLLW